jgi:hypothetical protein
MMKNILAALFAGCLTMSIAAVAVVIAADETLPPKAHAKKVYDRAGNDVIDAAIARQLAHAKARVQDANALALLTRR